MTRQSVVKDFVLELIWEGWGKPQQSKLAGVSAEYGIPKSKILHHWPKLIQGAAQKRAIF
jgi:hypothetical protein